MKLTIEVRAKPGTCQELYQTLQALVPTIRKEKGCRDCQLLRDVEDGDVFSLSVQWETKANLEHYVRSVSSGALFGAVDLLSETTRVKSGQDTPWGGIDTLKNLRKKM